MKPKTLHSEPSCRVSSSNVSWALLPWLLFGCLGPEASDKAGYSARLFDRRASVPSVEAKPALLQQIDTGDGLSSSDIVLHSGYSGGNPVRFWDFGTASTSVKPAWRIRRHAAGAGASDFGHLDIIDTVPGDTGYTPFRLLYTVFVTDAYAGQLITSYAALEDALELGLVEQPVSTDTYVDWPVTLLSAQLELFGDRVPVQPHPIYYRGQVATRMQLGDETGSPDARPRGTGALVAPNVYVLRRQSQPFVLDEALWHEDFTGNGDTNDTNTIFEVDATSTRYTGVWRVINVTVPAAYIWGSGRAESDLFTREAWGLQPIDGAVIDFTDTGTLVNRPVQEVAP